MKKMKKRRELDALVNGKLGRRKKGQHELLRNESDSSEVEEFSIPGKTELRKNSSCHFCATCMTVCGFFLLAACVAAIGGLVWVHIEMKKEVDQLRSQLGQVQLTPLKGLEQMSKKQLRLEKLVKDLQEKDVVNMKTSISKLITQMSAVNASMAKLQKVQSEDAGPQIENKELVQNIAIFGSKLATLEQDVTNLKTIQVTVDENHDKIQRIDMLAEDINNINFTTSSHFHEHLIAIRKLKNKTDSLDLRLGLVDIHQDVSPVPNIEGLVQSAIQNSLQDIQNLTEKQGNTNAEAVQHLESIVLSLQGQVDAINETLTFVQNTILQNKKDWRDDDLTTTTDSQLLSQLPAQLADYSQFKNKTIAQLQMLKESVGSLSGRVDHLEHPPSPLPATQGYPSPPPMTQAYFQQMPGATDDKATDLGDEAMKGQPSPPPLVQSTGGDGSTTPSADSGFLHLDSIRNKLDLVDLMNVDDDNDEQISYDELIRAFPDAQFSRDNFLRFDTDGDNKLGKEELVTAFGFAENDSNLDRETESSRDSKEASGIAGATTRERRVKRMIWNIHRNL